MDMISVFFIVVAVVFGLGVLIVLCVRCSSRKQTDRDIEARVQLSDLITDHERAKPPSRRPGQRGETRSSGKRLHKAAIMKHIHPACNSDSDAIQFSTEREKHMSGKYATEVNHVFKINPNEFIEAIVDRETVSKSLAPCQYWKCKKKQSGKFEVTERGLMHAVFRKSDGHLLIASCNETRQRVQRTDNRNRQNRRK